MSEISENVYILSSLKDVNIIIYKEQSNATVNQINEFFDYMIQISSGKKFHVIVDLTQSTLPNAQVRNVIRTRFSLLQKSILSHKVAIGNNYMIKVALKFVGASMGVKFNTYKSITLAKQAIEDEV